RLLHIIPAAAIGASAGGLEAVLAELPIDSGLAFVVIQHLDPARSSALPSLLSKATSLPVLEISNRIVIQPNHVYVAPPNKPGQGTRVKLVLHLSGRAS